MGKVRRRRRRRGLKGTGIEKREKGKGKREKGKGKLETGNWKSGRGKREEREKGGNQSKLKSK